MFDIGFWELSLIFVVALIILGPERLPRAARTVGLWVGKARQMLSSVKADIDRELKAEELKEMMKKRAAMPEVDDLVKDANETVSFDGDAAPGESSERSGEDKTAGSKKPSDSDE